LRPPARDGKPTPTGAAVRASKSTSTAAAPSMAKAEPSTSSDSASDGRAVTLAPLAASAHSDQKLTTPAANQTSPRSGERQDLVLSAGLEPSRSWLSANRYIVLALLLTVILVAAFVFLR